MKMLDYMTFMDTVTSIRGDEKWAFFAATALLFKFPGPRSNLYQRDAPSLCGFWVLENDTSTGTSESNMKIEDDLALTGEYNGQRKEERLCVKSNWMNI